MKPFTLVSTVFNESKRLSVTIQDIEAQTLRPSQIIITDAGSTDGTYEILQQWSRDSATDILILQKSKCNVAAGRNIAIEHAKYNLIVSTDFGCRFDPRWLESLVAPFDTPGIEVVGGGYGVDESSLISDAAKANYVLTGGYKIVLDDAFIPSSRSIAYYKSVWEKAGKYCEWLTLAADDLVYGKVLLSLGYRFHLVPAAYVMWGRHEKLKGYGKEAFRYGLGDGEARVNVRNTISLGVELLLRYGLFLAILLLVANLLWQIVPTAFFLLAVPGVFGLRSYLAAFRNWRSLKSDTYNFRIFLLALYLVEVTRLNYIKGFIKGYFYSTPEVKRQAKELAAILQ